MLILDDPTRTVEFISQDQEGNVLKDAIITVKNKAGVDLAGTKDDTSGTFKLTSKVNLGVYHIELLIGSKRQFIRVYCPK